MKIRRALEDMYRAAMALCLMFSTGQADELVSSAEEKEALTTLRRVIDPLAGQDNLKNEVKALVFQLGDDSFVKREAASRALGKMNPSIIRFLQTADVGDDPEVEWRIRKVSEVLQRKPCNVGNTINAAVDLLFEKENKELISSLLELMESSDQRVRYYAAYGIRRVTGKKFEFESYAEYNVRKRQVDHWRKWWQGSESGFVFANTRQLDQQLGIIIANDIQKSVILLDLMGNVLWERQLNISPKSVDILANGHYLVAHTKGACEFDRDNKKIWDDSMAGLGQEMGYDIQRVANGNTLICYVRDGHVRELAPDGKVVWQLKDLKSPGAAFRLPNGNTLFSENHAGQVIETDRDGNTVWKTGSLKNPCNVTMLENGNILVAEWMEKRALEINREGEIVWRYEAKKHVNGAFRLRDGTTIVAQEGAVVVCDALGSMVREIYTSNRDIGKIKVVPMPLLLPQG